MINDFLLAFQKYIKDEVIDYKLMNSNQNIVYLFKTKESSYIIKRYSKDAIKNIDDLNKRKEQIRISKIWNEHKIPCAIPITDIFLYQDNYYIIYPYIIGNIKKAEELTIIDIVSLAKVQAKTHKLAINSTLTNHCKTLPTNNPKIINIINKNNELLPLTQNNLCICQNDYKPLNIIWNNNTLTQIDFDAIGKNNPAISLLESAYTFSYRHNKIDFDYYEKYLKAYFNENNKIIPNLEEAIYCCWNGKIQWLNYLIENNQNDNDIEDLNNQIINYEKNIDKITEIIKKIIGSFNV